MADPAENEVPEAKPTIWHYMSAWKFKNLLDSQYAIDDWVCFSESNELLEPPPERGSLWFGLPESFGDRREATFPALNDDEEAYCREMAAFLKLSPEEAKARKEKFLSRNTVAFRRCVRGMANLCGATCWNKSDDESKDMWDIFANAPEDLAIKTTRKNLMESLFAPGSIAIKSKLREADIEYINHNSFFTPKDGFRNLLNLVRDDYEDERELRLTSKSPKLLQLPLTLDKPPEDADYERVAALLESTLHEWLQRGQTGTTYPGFHIPIDLSTLILEVRTNPDAQPDHIDGIKSAISGCGLSVELVMPSSLAKGK